MLEHLDSWLKFTLKPTAVESHYLSNFGSLNEEIDPKIGIYTKNWARQVLLENFDFWSRFVQKSTFWKLDVCMISEFQMKKWISKSECTQKTEWNRPFLKILTFRSKSKLYLVKTFSFSSFFLFKIFFCSRFEPGQVSRSVWVKPG